MATEFLEEMRSPPFTAEKAAFARERANHFLRQAFEWYEVAAVAAFCAAAGLDVDTEITWMESPARGS